MCDSCQELYEQNAILRAIIRFLEGGDPEEAEKKDLIRKYGSLKRAREVAELERREQEHKRTAETIYEEQSKCAKKKYYTRHELDGEVYGTWRYDPKGGGGYNAKRIEPRSMTWEEFWKMMHKGYE